MNIMQLANTLRMAKNPMQLFYQAAGQSPEGQQVLKLMQGKTPEQFKGVLENMAKERGTTLDQILINMGFAPRR